MGVSTDLPRAPDDHRAPGDHPDFGSRKWRAGNAIAGAFARIGLGPMHLLTTRGRRTGRPHTVPVVPVEHGGRRWLVAPYGPVSWVYDARAAGQVSLRRGRARRDYAIREAPAGEAGPVLKRYVDVATRTRGCFEATEISPVEEFVAEAGRHPVFELTPLPDRGEAGGVDEAVATALRR